MEWWQTLVTALFTYAVTKIVDYIISSSQEERNFQKLRREKMLQEIEDLKDAVGRFYELAANWKSYEMKAEQYKNMMLNEDNLIGKYNKYPEIASQTRDLIHTCNIIMSAERGDIQKGTMPAINVMEYKTELSEKHKKFLSVCDIKLDKRESIPFIQSIKGILKKLGCDLEKHFQRFF